MFDKLEKYLSANQAAGASRNPDLLETLLVFGGLMLLYLLAALLVRRLLKPLVAKAVQRTPLTWDNRLAEHGFFNRLLQFIPLVLLYLAADFISLPNPLMVFAFHRLVPALFVVLGVGVFESLLSGLHDIYRQKKISANKPIRGYVQAAKIVVYLFGGVIVIAVLMNKSPWGLISVLGGLTAILLLVFKDTILGLMAGIQLAAYDMVRVGDWIEMPKYGADGDVVDVSLHTVKVRNWDKTITTIPTYVLVSDTFKNWRGMQESGGRRIKRCIFIDMTSIRFCDAAMLAEFGRIGLLAPYLAAKQAEITAYNQERQIDTSLVLNGRQQTNVGVFRAYVEAYLHNNPKIHQEMTFLVRHLEPTSQGLPLEIYVFSRDQVWANYEAIQADIFDHLLAAAPYFGLRVFQYPSGHDLQAGFSTGPGSAPSGSDPGRVQV